MIKKLTLFLIVIKSIYSFGQNTLNDLLKIHNKNNVPYISVQELSEINSRNFLVLDAREPKEYQISHINSAVNVGYNYFNLDEVLKILPKNKNYPIVVYCSLGIRSEKIAHHLIKKGFNEVYNLYGGIFDWKNKGYPLIDSIGNKTENIHAFSEIWGKWLQKGNKIYD